ncbi:ComGF family competence protein [Lentibacillus saliphilus]|uniref:ComGF family competence protein n=1 Tax=Lentibacillus saliphilus TaxID=2737028 RepID=UPI001C2F5125|nr:ComGF family competence protein [Lentibacillus saliphilus]
MDSLQNNKGFSFVSILFALAALTITLPFLIQLISLVHIHDNYDALSISRFFSYMQDEAIRADDWSITTHTLQLQLPDGETAEFSQRGQLLIRRLKGGHEVFLRDVARVGFSPLPYGVRITITTIQGESYAKKIIFY